MRPVSRAVLSATMSLFGIASPSLGGCVGTNNFTLGAATAHLSFAAGVPSHVQAALFAGADRWNDSSCNPTGVDFPYISQSQFSTSVPITIEYVDGLSPEISPNKTTCGSFQHSSSTVTIYSKVKFPDEPSIEYDCPGDSAGLAFLATHELGHALGLANSPCTNMSCFNYVMDGGTQFHNSYGDITWSFPTAIHPEECDMVDEANEMPNEDVPGCPPDDRNCDGQQTSTPLVWIEGVSASPVSTTAFGSTLTRMDSRIEWLGQRRARVTGF